MLKRTLVVLIVLSVLLLTACYRPMTDAASIKAGQANTVSVETSEIELASGEDKPPTILVTGATGTQGGAVARNLLRRGYTVRALTRDTEGAGAKALANLGAELVQGDFDDVGSIAAAMKGVDGVFAVTLFWTGGFDGEVEQGRRLVDEAAKAGVGHFILTSVASADQSTNIPHFDSKWEVEQYLQESTLNWTIIRPVEFMDNWNGSAEDYRHGKLVDPRAANSSHQWIAASDIGFIVAEAFESPSEWLGVTLEIAGDEMTVGKFCAQLAKALGIDVVHDQVSWEEFASQAGEEVALMYRWFENDGYAVDVVTLRERYPNLISIKEFLADSDWNNSILTE
ncbi:MAG: hypothetical protein ACJAYC_002013 [Halieaceae bacterium]